MAENLPGAVYTPDKQCTFSVWAPEKQEMTLHLISPKEQKIKMLRDREGYFRITLSGIEPGTRYLLQPDAEEMRPDPASFFQPDGVHAPSSVVDHHQYPWKDGSWKGIPFKELVLYELHVGTFTEEGTFEAIIPRLDDLYACGINALEIMPVSQFPGARNWGYDGVYPYAVQNTYGGPDGLKKLVDACHEKGIAVFLDVVYNHLGPEGNYLGKFGRYFTHHYNTPWGDAINFDDAWSDGVRDYFVNNMLYWFEVYHIDGLRLDAIHTIYDNGAVHFWALAGEEKKQLEQRTGRIRYLIAESDLNNPKVVQPPAVGGFGFDAQWLDDFHHALYVLVHPPGKERYEDFGDVHQLAKAYKDGFVHSGEYVNFRKRKFGTSSAGVPGDRFVAFNQNHDQVGNRVLGERLTMLVDNEMQKITAAALLLSPYVPMLFMGEEYADDTPFFYFVSHSDKQLIEAVREGRKKEFAAYKGEGTPPDAQEEDTFLRSKIRWTKRTQGHHAVMLRWHTRLLQLRRSLKALTNFDKNDIRTDVFGSKTLAIHRQTPGAREHVLILLNFSDQPADYVLPSYVPYWDKILDSNEEQWTEESGTIEDRTPAISLNAEDNVTIKPLSVVVFAN